MYSLDKKTFIEKHLKVTNANIQWKDKFISHFSIGHPQSGADGFISCSLHFYSKKIVREGMSWFVIASPVNTKIKGNSLYDCCIAKFGDSTIAPTVESG